MSDFDQTRFFILLAAILLLPLLGCGLKEYEERMDQERKRAKLFDYTENLLDERLEPPMIKDKNAWRFEVFLRLPRGCLRAAAKNKYGKDDMLLYRFPFGQDKPKDDKPESQEKAGWNIFVGSSASRIATTDDFRRRVLLALREYYATELKLDFSPPKDKLVAVEDMEPEYSRLEFAGPKDSLFQMYVHQNGADHIAVIFQTPKDAAPSIKDNRDACLKSLDISEDAALKSAQFMSSRKTRK